MTIKLASIITALVILSSVEIMSQTFKAQQSKNSRVKVAIAEKEDSIKQMFQQKKISYPPRRIFIRAFKRERALELWASNADKFEFVKQYQFCASSGTLGPKRRQGDNQIPEGFYHINRFNPASNFYLSLGVSYPNQSDRALGGRGDLGGDIFIHGDCVTIGCIPITDDGIKELYLIAVEARSAGQSQIPVHIFPTRMDDAGMRYLERKDGSLRDFWMNLKEGHDFFEKERRLPVVTVDARGRYLFR
jgi:murein L,D-transpeptidase YafK